jgi:serine/threonine protein kinase
VNDEAGVAEASAAQSSVYPAGGSTPPRRYTLLHRLATGGMGELLLAKASGAGGVQKLVAIKRIRPEYASDPTFVSMFLNEARLAATLDHPNVVRTYDLVDDAGAFFMVMEYLHGEPLGRLLNALGTTRERVPLGHVVTIALGIAAGLHCAHERRGVDGRPLDIVHRDLSPGNVFITYEGGVKLLDFGIAKATSRTSITLGPTRKGKVSYMSPEQCVGAEVDRRSDVFALGVVLWELCTGRRLFRGDNEFAIMNQITTVDAPSPIEHAPDLPPALAEIILAALRRDRDARLQTAMELHEAIEAFAKSTGLMPSTTALGRYLGETCGTREYPSVVAAEEFADPMTSTLVVRSGKATAPRRRWSLVAALVAGAAAGGAVVAAMPSSSTAAGVTAIDESPAAEVDEPRVESPPPAPIVVAAPLPIVTTPPPPEQVEVVAPESTRTPEPRRRANKSKKPTRPEPVATPAKSDKVVHGVDGLLPGG